MEPQREIGPKDTLYWETIEHNHHKKGRDWFWVVGIISLAIIVSSILFGNLTFAAVITLLTLLLFIESNREAEIIKVGVDKKGIYVNKSFHSFETITSFYIEQEQGIPRLILKSSKFMSPYIVIPLIADIDIDDVEFFLGYYLDQEKLQESLFQIILEYIGF